MPRIREVSTLMVSTNPDLSTFAGHGGKLIVLEHMADYAQSPYAGIRYFRAVQSKMGVDRVAEFMRLWRRSRWLGCACERRHAVSARHLGREGQCPRRAHGNRAELGGFSQGRAGTAPLPVARLAQVQGRRCGQRTKLRLRAITAPVNGASQPRKSWRTTTSRRIGRGRGSSP